MRTFFQDLGYALRLVRRRPGLTFVTAATLALGIGGNGAVFSVASSLLLRPLPVADPDRLVRVFGTSGDQQYDVMSYPNLRDLAARTRTLSSVALHQQTFTAFGLDEATEQVALELVSGSYFSTMGVSPAGGRFLAEDDDREDAGSRVAVVSARWANTRLGGVNAALESTIHLNGAPFTVVGVAPPAFHGSYDALGTDVWVPLMTYGLVRPRTSRITQRGWGWLSATARLAPGVAVAEAQAEMNQIAAALRTEFAPNNDGLGVRLTRASAMPESMGELLGRVLLFALIIAGLTLAAACANVANAQLATVLQRHREVAVRLAMGATRGRIVRQWLTESLLIAAMATGAGLLAALWIRETVVALRPPQGLDNFAPTLVMDWRLLLFAAALMTGATLIFGGLPAVRASRLDIAPPLKDENTTTVGSQRRWWLQAALVSAQVAISLALLVSAGLLIRSLASARLFDVGFNTRHLTIASAQIAGLGLSADQSREYYRQTAARVRALPGVTGVTFAAVVPLGNSAESRGVIIDGYTPPNGRRYVSTPNNIVGPGYFEFMGIAVVRGRAFVPGDFDAGAPLVAIVNETMARRYWDGNPIGRIIRSDPKTPIEVVGVARDSSYYNPGEPPMPYLYVPAGPLGAGIDMAFHVRTAGPDPGLPRALTRELRAMDPRVNASAGSYDELRQLKLYPQRAMASICIAFGVVVLLLAAVGLYGVMSYVVSSRGREFAVRLALGARPSGLVRAVLRQGLVWCGAGLALGVLLSALLGRFLRSFLFGVSASDVVSYGTGALVLTATALLAAYLPARRVTRIDPSATLRN
jgi:predicted permease